MKSLKSSLLHKIIAGYRIVSMYEGIRSGQWGGESIASHLQIQPSMEATEALKLPSSTIREISNEMQGLQSDILKAPADESSVNSLKNRVENLEQAAISSGAYLVPSIMNSISRAKEKVRELEVGSSQEIEPITEAKKQIEELEREKKVLEEAKMAMMEKYYNRDIDEASLKNIIDSYEQRLVETDIKIKKWKEELGKLEKEPMLSQKSQAEKKERFLTALEAVKLNTPRNLRLMPEFAVQAPIGFKLAKAFQPALRGYPAQPRYISEIETQENLRSPAVKVEAEKAEIINKPREKMEGIEIPQMPKNAVKTGSIEQEEELHPISLTYPLIPRLPSRNEPVFAYAKIFWDQTNNRYEYQIIEPKMTDKLKGVYIKVKEMLEQRLDIEFSKLKKIEAKEFLDSQIDDVLTFFNFALTLDEKRILKYYMIRDFVGLEMIEPLMQDPNIEDISCDGVGIPIFIFHRNSDIGSVPTNISFETEEQLESFLIRLSQLSGKSISVSDPLLDGTLKDGSRVQATLGIDIARRGSNFTIRKFTEEPLTPVHLMNYGTLDSSLLAYMWLVVDYGRSILVSGGTASGKTSLLNVLSLFIRPEKKIVSIEDTAELQLPHPHWVPVVARTPISIEGKGEVDMFELLKESLRQRPDYIVVGEVRGKEAYILFQQMATGHPSLATMHAENIDRLINRLISPPISLPAGLISSLDIVIFIARMKYKNKFVRKVVEVVEIVDFDAEKNVPITNQVYKWNPRNDKFEITNKSLALKKITDITGMDEKDIKSEIERRLVVLEWMKKNNILDYRDVHKIFSIFYADPEKLLSVIQGAS